MENLANALWGMAFVMSPLVIFVILIVCPGRKWVAPLMIIVPSTIYFISEKYFVAAAIFQGVATAIFLYGFYILLVALVNALRKPKKELGK